MKRRVMVVALAAVTACGIFESGPEEDLQDHRRAWDRLGISDYSFDYIRSCFCGGPAGDTLRIVVRGDSVVSVENRGPRNVPIDTSVYSGWVVSIDGLFDELELAIARDADRVDIEFDQQFSYPQQVRIDYIKNAIDDEMSFQVTRFQVLR